MVQHRIGFGAVPQVAPRHVGDPARPRGKGKTVAEKWLTSGSLTGPT